MDENYYSSTAENSQDKNNFFNSVKNTFRWIWDVFKGFIFLIILAFICRYAIIQPFVVDGNSMDKNFHNKEYLLINKLSYTFTPPARGDVIVFRYPLDPQITYIKRIIGLPGEKLEIKNNQVYINNQLIDESYLSFGQKTSVENSNDFKIQLGDDEYFVMGDNRIFSSDSRVWGTVPKVNIVGKAWFAVTPLTDFGIIKNSYFPIQSISLR